LHVLKSVRGASKIRGIEMRIVIETGDLLRRSSVSVVAVVRRPLNPKVEYSSA
jgi:hypothetical protein